MSLTSFRLLSLPQTDLPPPPFYNSTPRPHSLCTPSFMFIPYLLPPSSVSGMSMGTLSIAVHIMEHIEYSMNE